jgi:hypothetical protein
MSDEFTKGVFGQYDGLPEDTEPILPELRLFAVTRYKPLNDEIETLYIAASNLAYSGEVLILQAISYDRKIQRLVKRTVRAFASWIDVEVVPMQAIGALKH